MYEYYSAFLVVWSVICPIGGHEVKVSEEFFTEKPGMTVESRNLIECPEHHLALWARPEEWKFIRRDAGVAFIKT